MTRRRFKAYMKVGFATMRFEKTADLNMIGLDKEYNVFF